MRSDDLKRLKVPFSEGDQRSPSDQFWDALDLNVPEAMRLEREILSDLDPERFGIGWWTGHVPTKRRILIGDQLYAACAAMAVNVCEAKLHLLEAEDFFERASKRPPVSVIQEGTNLNALPLQRRMAVEHLPSEMAKLHMIGFLRAVGSALDCLGTAVIGVLALPTGILRGDLAGARKRLTKVLSSGAHGSEVQFEFARRLEELVVRQGPPGWLDWTLAARNQYVHRGRHTHPWLLQPTGSEIWIDTKRRQHGIEALLLLPREPGRSEVDALRDLKASQVLTEPAQVTLRGVMESSAGFVNALSKELLRVWQLRRANPTLLVQPVAQWPEDDLPTPGVFEGYAPGSIAFSPDSLFAAESYGRRIKAAALAGDRQRRWEQFD